MKTFLAHLKYWGEAYKAGPIVIAILIVSTWMINRLTGTDSAEDIGSIVGSLIDGVRFVIVCMLAALAQHFLYGYRSEIDSTSLSSDIHDSCVSSFLLLLVSAIVFGWLK